MHRIRYEGPAALAIEVATRLADADGVELTASEPPERAEDGGDQVVLVVTVDGTSEAVTAALDALGDALPEGATIAVEP